MNQDYLASSTETVCSRPVDAMTNLSPAAQAVLDATYQEMDYAPRRHVQWAAIAALRAAADQVEQKLRGFSREACQEIRAIAAELEGAQ